ncbi:hypothetical protein SAMN02927937_00280 [Paenimyroides aquimaris]|uniref:Uncharacterized protein n=1 Tax=Paenimyroides marinum TaxID=1159016 RepID=A0A1H6J973_9FLAO|nr:hypothetical protein SAMN02927937_00280 [Paenimyroides aquimaris]
MRTLRLKLQFYKSTLLINLLVSLSILFLTKSVSAFIFSLTVIGFLAAIFYKEVYRKNEYYLYYNAGLSKLQLVLFCFLINCVWSFFIKILCMI